jgi:Vitamin K epoxide reductase family
MSAQQLRYDLREADDPEMRRRRRAIISLSLVGMAAMTPVSLLQTGIVRHLPDPPVGDFHSDETNLSDPAYRFGTPDGTLALASLAANVPLAAFGGRFRARQQPLLALLTAGKAVADAAGAAGYFWKMLSGKEPWCPYCITGAVATFGILALTLPEAVTAMETLGRQRNQSRDVRLRNKGNQSAHSSAAADHVPLSV